MNSISSLLTTICVCLLLKPAAPAQSDGLTDTVSVATRNDEARHAVQWHGTAPVALVGDMVGGHNMVRPARCVRGRGSWLSYRLRIVPDQPVTLEIEEMYDRDTDVRGYLVLADNAKVYLRTFQGCGAGPVHYFVQLPPRNRNTVAIKLVNQLDTTVSISRIWAFSNFTAYFAGSGMAVPYCLAPTIHLSYSNHDEDLRGLRQIKDSLGNHPDAQAAWTTWIPYANLDDHDLASHLDYILRLADELALPVQLAFDSWWGNTPHRPDGKGGSWTDVKYQQVVYNWTKRQYQLSVPNQWSNTPWLTVNNPDLNAFKAARLRSAMALLRQRHRALLAQGKQGLILALNTDNEPVYWASGNAGLGSDLLLADFNASTVAAARRDEVTLDPTDGLDTTERQWLSQNLLHYNTMIADVMASALGDDAPIVAGDHVRLPDDLLRHNIYTQAMVANPALQYPRLDARFPFWETAAPAGVRVGGEWNGNSLREIEAVTHQLALGRNAAVNAECGNDAANMQAVLPGYALAQRFCALYNYPLDKMDVAASDLRDLSRPFPPYRYQPVLLEDSFRDDRWQQHVVAFGGLQTGLIGNTAAIAIYPASNNAPGYLTYKLEAPGGAFDTGMVLEFSGRAFVFRKQDPSVNIRVLAGLSPDTLQEAGRVFDTGDINAVHPVDLGAMARGRQTIYIRLELNALGLPASVLTWCAIYHLRFTLPWPPALTQGLLPQDESLATVRQQNLVVSWRRDAELAMEELEIRLAGRGRDGLTTATRAATSYLKAARAAFMRGNYAHAYRAANQGLVIH